jgi:hypothetical protein
VRSLIVPDPIAREPPALLQRAENREMSLERGTLMRDMRATGWPW